MEDMGGVTGGGGEGVIPEGTGAPQEVCRCAPIERSRGEEVHLQYSILHVLSLTVLSQSVVFEHCRIS